MYHVLCATRCYYSWVVVVGLWLCSDVQVFEDIPDKSVTPPRSSLTPWDASPADSIGSTVTSKQH